MSVSPYITLSPIIATSSNRESYKNCNNSLLAVSNQQNNVNIYYHDIHNMTSLNILPLKDSVPQMDSIRTIKLGEPATNLIHSKRYPLLLAQGSKSIELFNVRTIL